MSGIEFSREVRLDTLGSAPRALAIEAHEEERAALARRFGLVALEALAADLTLTRDGAGVALTGRLRAEVVQTCVASGAPVAAKIDEPIAVRFRDPPTAGRPDEEVELGENDLDVMFIESGAIDVGEAAAQGLALALDPFPRAPEADSALREAGVKSEEEAGPFAALAALKGKPKDQP